MILKLTSKKHLTDNIWSFRFEPSEPLTWTAGQFMRVELPHEQPDEEGTKRWFTISSAPHEDFIQITTRVTDTTFKQALAALPENGELQLLEEPTGDFVWQDSELPIVFVAGGIGVTPFRSMLKQLVHEGAPVNVSLVYANRSSEIPFKEEIDQWVEDNQGIKVRYLTDARLTAELLAELEPELYSSLVYVSGPEPMVESLGDELKASGLPETQLKQDFFPNYDDTNY